jgi:hypothetical protein
MEEVDELNKKRILFLLNNVLYYSGTALPLQNCVSIERKDLYKIKRYPYKFYIKNDEIEKRAILFFFKDSDNSSRCVIIEKNLKMYNVDIVSNYTDFGVFDISFTDLNEITIYDIYINNGQNITLNDYVYRHMHICLTKFQSKTYKIKPCIYYSDIKEVPNGFTIFMISNKKVIFGNNYTCFKWKNPELINFSLKVIEEQEDLLMYASNYKKDVLFAKVHNSDINGNEHIKTIKNLTDYKNECVIEINTCDNKIHIIKLSENFPSSLRSIEKIIQLKNENIKLEELL